MNAPSPAPAARKAVLSRMVMPAHVRPFGLKSRHLLRRRGCEVEDRWLATRSQQGRVGELVAAGALRWVSPPVALFIGGIGAASVFKAAYVDGRELRCACVGGSGNVPLGVVSLTENLTMVATSLWMLVR